ncbi:hypothetical protein Cpir12675_006074 [Ceratocystis pirilliformis]|uniref:Uncharacterized protein n=1 Tax=Ceratocystis pirilliformis TaxID=259994 RepID=A0ABR3YMV6_9PEZI
MKSFAFLSVAAGLTMASVYGEPPSYGSPSSVSSQDPVYPGSSSSSSQEYIPTTPAVPGPSSESTEHWPGNTPSSAVTTTAYVPSVPVPVPGESETYTAPAPGPSTGYLSIFSEVSSYLPSAPASLPPSSYIPVPSSYVPAPSSDWVTSVVSLALPSLPGYSYGASSVPASSGPATEAAPPPVSTTLSKYPVSSSPAPGSEYESSVSTASPVTQSNNGSYPSYTGAVPPVISTAGAARLLPFRFF